MTHETVAAGAACLDFDTELFFDEEREREAKQVCRSCPVQEVCLETNLREKDGVWGGMNARERFNFLRARQKRRRLAAIRAAS